MNLAADDQSFELRRFPDLRSPAFKLLGIYLVMIAWQHWLFALGVVCVVFVYRFWRLRDPADQLQLSGSEIRLQAGWFQRIRIQKDQVEEISPASRDIIIAWKRDGVPHYTRVNSSWFEAGVWQKACPALLAWGTAPA